MLFVKILPGLLLVVMTAAACGGADGEDAAETAAASESAAAEASASAEASRSAAAEARQAAKEQAQEEAWSKCVDDTKRLNATLREIDGRLDVGLNYDQLGDRLGDVAVAYNALNIKAMDTKCTLNVGIALESAYNQYNKSHSRWANCIEDYNCEVAGPVLAALRKNWSEASERLEYVEKFSQALIAMRRPKTSSSEAPCCCHLLHVQAFEPAASPVLDARHPIA